MTSIARSLAAVFVLVVAAPLPAETTLRWKLAPDERLKLVVEQQTMSEVTAVGRTTTTQIDLTMTLDWTVTSVEDDQITLRQALERVQFRMDSPNVPRVVYDSATRMQPIGAARDVADALAPLLQQEVEIVMDPRGQVLKATATSDAAADEKTPAESGGAGVLTREKIEQLLKQPLALLPEKPVNPGDTWKRESEMESAAGKVRQTTTYEYVGPVAEDEAGRDDLHRIQTSSTLTLQPAAAGAPLTLKKHEQSGTILFSVQQGRLVTAEQSQTLATERPYRDTTIGVTLKSKQTTRLLPRDEPPAEASLTP